MEEIITSTASWKVVNNNSTIMADNKQNSYDDSSSHRQVVMQNEINENDVLSGRGSQRARGGQEVLRRTRYQGIGRP